MPRPKPHLHRLHHLGVLIALVLVGPTLPLVACDTDTTTAPKLELYIGGALSVTAPTLNFPNTELGKSSTATFELKNLGPGPVELTNRPPLLLERDDRLSFRVLQPETPTIARGETLTVTARFLPTAAGPSTARLVIAAAHLDEPITILMTGQAAASTSATLTVTLDNAPPENRYDFGRVAPLSAKNATLRLQNTGTAPLTLGENPLSLTDPDGHFALGTLTTPSLAPNESVAVPVTFSPKGCGPLSATLTVAVPNTPTLFIELAGQGGDNPGKVPNTTDTTQLRAPDLDVAVSDLVEATGKRRVAVGNLTVGSFAGQVVTLGWDGCVAAETRILSATQSGLTAPLFGNTTALSADGRLMLVTARDQRRDAWLFALDPDGTARFLTTLITTQEAFGHGRGAALSADGSTALVGQTGASNGINTHGAIFVYEREDAWGARPDHAHKLVPSLASEVELVGAWVDTSENGDLVVSGALGAAADSDPTGPAMAFLWSRPPGGIWGQVVDGPGRLRTEDLRLVTLEVPSDSAARVAVSADASTVALGVASSNGTRIHLYLKEGALWGIGRDDPTERGPNATLTFPARPELRFALSATADLLIAGDTLGVLELDRGEASSWAERVVSSTAPADRDWAAPIYGQLALSPDGSTIVGVGADGAAWFIARDASP